MARKPITQKVARDAIARVRELEQAERDRLSAYRNDYPGGVHVATLSPGEREVGRLQASQMLGAALVGRQHGEHLYVYAVLRTTKP